MRISQIGNKRRAELEENVHNQDNRYLERVGESQFVQHCPMVALLANELIQMLSIYVSSMNESQFVPPVSGIDYSQPIEWVDL